MPQIIREIEFRGIDKLTNGWVYGYVYVFENRVFIIEKTNIPPERIEVIPESVGQFIGLFDKTKTKIYEADILDDGEGRRGEVVFDSYRGDDPFYRCDGAFVVNLQDNNAIGENDIIVGNKHKNPELLKP